MTLVELAVCVGVGSVILSSAGMLMSALLRMPLPDAVPQRLDRACERLRRDLAHGGTINGGVLTAGGVAWTFADGELQRAGSPQVRLRTVAWSRTDGTVQVELIPDKGPARRLAVPQELP